MKELDFYPVSLDVRCYGEDTKAFEKELAWAKHYSYKGEGFAGYKIDIAWSVVFTTDWVSLSKACNSTIALTIGSPTGNYWLAITYDKGKVIHHCRDEYTSVEDVPKLLEDYLNLAREADAEKLEDLCVEALMNGWMNCCLYGATEECRRLFIEGEFWNMVKETPLFKSNSTEENVLS